jgi:hypothetical protein
MDREKSVTTPPAQDYIVGCIEEDIPHLSKGQMASLKLFMHTYRALLRKEW